MPSIEIPSKEADEEFQRSWEAPYYRPASNAMFECAKCGNLIWASEVATVRHARKCAGERRAAK